MRVARPLVEAAERAGAARAPLLRAAGVTLAALNSLDAKISRAQLYRLLEAMLALTRDPAFGLHCIEKMSPHAFNPVTDLVFHARDLRQSMGSFQQFVSLLSEDVSPGSGARSARAWRVFGATNEQRCDHRERQQTPVHTTLRLASRP
jgi:hypothetical protein